MERPDLAQRAEVLYRLSGEPRGRDAYLSAVTSWAEKQEPGLEDEQAEESVRRRKHELAKECLTFLRRFFQAWQGAPAEGAARGASYLVASFRRGLGRRPGGGKEDANDAAALDQLWGKAGQWLDREERRHGSGGRA